VLAIRQVASTILSYLEQTPNIRPYAGFLYGSRMAKLELDWGTEAHVESYRQVLELKK
jgi:hypothetical protein